MSTSKANQILLITASSRASDLQAALQDALNTTVYVVATFTEAGSVISAARYQAVVVDEGLADLEPNNADRFLDRLTDELPIFVKLAISGIPRCVQQVHLALRRFERERKAASYSISVQVRDSLTSILVRSQLAMKVPELPEPAADHLESVINAAEGLQEMLGAETAV